MPLSSPLDADRFRLPLGSGILTAALDYDDVPDDGYYVATGFGALVDLGNGPTYHLGEDWSGERGGDTDLGDPVSSIANGVVVEVVADQGSATTGFGNYVVVRHDLANPIVVDGQTVTQVYSLYAHLDTATYSDGTSIAVGDAVELGEQIGTIGSSGFADTAHLHFEITLNDTLPTSDDGYNPAGAPLGWTDPSNFIQSANTLLADPESDAGGAPNGDLVVETSTTAVPFDGSGFDATRVISATWVEANGMQYIYYAGEPFGNSLNLGVAISTDDGQTWSKASDIPIIPPDVEPYWASFRLLPVRSLYEDGLFKLWFWGNSTNLFTESDNASGFGYASSADGLEWTVVEEPIRIEYGPREGARLLEVVKLGDEYLAYYDNHTNGMATTYLATSIDGVSFNGVDQIIPFGSDYRLAAASISPAASQGFFAIWQHRDTGDYVLSQSSDGLHFEKVSNLIFPDGFRPNDISLDDQKIIFYGSQSEGNVNWGYGNYSVAIASATFPSATSLIDNAVPEAAGTNKTINANTTITLTELFSWSDPDGIDDVVAFAVRDRDIGGGYLTENGIQLADGQLYDNIPISQISQWAFVSGADGEFDNIEFAVTDSYGNVSDAIVAYVESSDAPVELEKATSMQLEYFARVAAYLNYVQDPDSGDWSINKSDEGIDPDEYADHLAYLELAEETIAQTGYRVSNVFVLGEFQAVALEGHGKEPVLAIRGTAGNILDWRFNFDSSIAPGYNDFEAAWQLTSEDGIRNWVLAQDSFSLTGHSQGGSQAQLLAAYATDNGVPISLITTFNSPGISNSFIAAFYQPSLVGSVEHYVSAGDVVEMVGEAYLEGNIIRYDITTADFTPTGWFGLTGGLSYAKKYVGNTHTNHWAISGIYDSPLHDGRPQFDVGPITPSTISSEEYSSSNFSHMNLSESAMDPEYVGFLVFIDNIPDHIWAPLKLLVPVFPDEEIGAFVAEGLSRRGSAEKLRPNMAELLLFIEDITEENLLSEIKETVEAAINAVALWGTESVQATKNWTIDTWAGISNFNASIWDYTKSLPDMFWQAVSSWTTEKWEEVSQWSEEVWSQLSSFSENVWYATIDGTSAVLKAIGEFTDQLAQLGAEAWDAMSMWTADQWNAVADWEIETWGKAKDFSAEVWQSTIGAVSGFFDNLKSAPDAIIGIGNFLIDSAEGAALQTWASANDLASWVGDRFAPDEGVVVAEGSNGGSTPAVVLDVQESNFEILSSSGAQSIFLLTDPGTTVNIQSGGNIIWGMAQDQAGTKVNGGITETDVHFIQNAFFETDDLDKEKGSAIIRVDLDQDGASDITITWEGDYRLESIVAEQNVDGTYIRYLGNGLVEAGADAFVTTEDSILVTDNALLNDTDADGDPLSIVGLDTTNTLGVVTNNGDGTFTYDPNGAFDWLDFGESANDEFVYSVTDSNGSVDSATVTITINGLDDEPVPNLIMGTDASDYLVGTEDADAIRSLGGSYDRMTGGAGADRFVFGTETQNGVRERDVIRDYEVGLDSIVLVEGAGVGSIRQSSSGAVVFLEGDGDVIYVHGDGVGSDNLMIFDEAQFDFT